MRTEKYDHSKKGFDNDDISYALQCNPQSSIIEKDIDVIVAEVCGEADGADWHWIVQRKDGKFQYLTGGCDYTGWDCQSSLKSSSLCDTALEAANLVDPESDSRRVKEVLIKQLNGELPFAIYTDENR